MVRVDAVMWESPGSFAIGNSVSRFINVEETEANISMIIFLNEIKWFPSLFVWSPFVNLYSQ